MKKSKQLLTVSLVAAVLISATACDSTSSIQSDFEDVIEEGTYDSLVSSLSDNVSGNENSDNSTKKATVIDAGMYKVGSDIPEGEYLISPLKLAYYELSSDSSGALTSIISNDNFSGTRYITVKEGEYITLNRCQMTPVEEIEAQLPVDGLLSNGMYKVGFDITAGEYKIKSDSQGYYEVRSDSRGELSGIITNDNFEGEKYITVSDGQYIKLSNCSLIVE